MSFGYANEEGRGDIKFNGVYTTRMDGGVYPGEYPSIPYSPKPSGGIEQDFGEINDVAFFPHFSRKGGTQTRMR